MTFVSSEVIVKPSNFPIFMGQIREWLKVEDNRSDATIIGLVRTAALHIEKDTGLKLSRQTLRLKYSAWEDKIILPVGPIASVSAINYLNDLNVNTLLGTGIYTYIPATDIAEPYVRRQSGQVWPTLYASETPITIDVVVGYETANDVPDDIQTAMMLMITQWFDNRGDSTDRELKRVPIGAYELLENYRIPGFA